MDKFTVTIELGDDAMQDGQDVARALKEVARKVRDLRFSHADGGGIMDLNGNSVGKWEVK